MVELNSVVGKICYRMCNICRFYCS